MDSIKKKTSLRLVISNPVIKQENLVSYIDKKFGMKIERKSESMYRFLAREPINSIGGRLSLEICGEIDKDDFENTLLICHFPDMLCGELYEDIDKNKTLYEIIMIQFQIKILEHLMTFGRENEISNLLIYVDNTGGEHPLKIYSHIAIYENKKPFIDSTKTELFIPINQETVDKWLSFTAKVKQDFLYTLWSKKNNDTLVRDYLVSNHSNFLAV